MSAKASYTVIIAFNKAYKECAIGEFKSGYLYSKNNQDDYKFDSSKITINLKRSRSYADGTILSNDMNSINSQIKKAIVIYYALAKDFPKIKQVSIVRNYKRKQNFIYTETNNIIQPIKLSKYGVKLAIAPACARALINEDSKAFALRAALTYWLCGQAVDNDYYEFDKYWRAFDRLILYNGKTTKEYIGICEMKKLIISNPKIFSKSTAYVRALTPQQIRNLDWITFLLSKKQRMSDILKEYSDAGICKMFSQIINDKRINTILHSNNEFSNINTHLKKNYNTINEVELLILIALTYVYYIRCKMFHAEIPDGSFKIAVTKEDANIKMLNGLIKLIILELINNSNLMR
jgi:hypothetical protein